MSTHFPLSHSQAVYDDLLRQVVQAGAFSPDEMERGSHSLSDKKAQDIAKGKAIDARVPLLMTISGKGGWTEGPDFEKYRHFRNVTLLDHLLSVTRGALVLGELDLQAAGVPEAELPTRLARIAVAAFLHDADKMLDRGRQTYLDAAAVAQVRQRYNIDAFLHSYNAPMSDAELLAWIDAAEVTRAGRVAQSPHYLTPQDRNDTVYIRAADRMDGLFLDTRKGIMAAVAELDAFPDFRTSAPKLAWKVIEMRVPHTPFLADLIQDVIAQSCRRLYGVPPLFQIHQDGILTMAIPPLQKTDILQNVERALKRFFVRGARVDVNNKLAVNILDGGACFDDIVAALATEPRIAGKCLPLPNGLISADSDLRSEINSLFAHEGPSPTWPDFDKATGATISPWGDGARDTHETTGRTHQITQAAALAAVVFCAPPKETALAARTLTRAQRMEQLLALMNNHGVDIPEWVSQHPDTRLRDTLIVLIAANAKRIETLFKQDLETTLIQPWLEGNSTQAGIFDRHEDGAGRFVKPPLRMLAAALDKTFMPGDENLPHRCHFTNLPVSADSMIRGTDGLYGINMTAFSGRSGRPESPFSTSQRGTFVSPEAYAEHRLRTLRNTSPSGDVPLLVSTPTTVGLFTTLGTNAQTDPEEFSTYDVLRVKMGKEQCIYRVDERLDHPDRFARYESMPLKLEDQIDFVLRILKLARRIGRPVHVFRGAPTPTAEFVFFDSLPGPFRDVFGARNGLRLEQIPSTIRILETIQKVTQTNGLGISVARGLLHHNTRFATACLGTVLLDRMPETDTNKNDLAISLFTLAKESWPMTDHPQSAIVDFAEAMTYYQKAYLRTESNAVKDMGFVEALAAVQTAHRLGITDRQSLIDAVVAAITLKMERGSTKHYASIEARESRNLQDALAAAATLFVDGVWKGLLKSRSPATTTRQMLGGVYRVAFARHHAERSAQRAAVASS